ncbi:MAG: 4-hydroxy-3-methylbut-2-enyl diphosphate reductase [Bacteroidales bacterium]|nr:4-hydroxy-3-methylbut-2-enyl diphosphate reductase [Bacteroidales bacterium]
MIKVGIDPHSGFCGGVIRAIGTAEGFLAGHGGSLCSLGAIVHNEEELARLAALGLITIDKSDIGALAPGSTVLIRAHGEPPSTYEALRQAGVDVIDCTCPVVLRLQKQIREASERAQVVIFGKIGHPEVLGLVGQTGGTALVVENVAGLQEAISGGQIAGDGAIELFSQTTKSPEEFAEVAAALEAFAGGRLTVHSTICAQVSGRHRQLAEFARSNDVVVFVSGRSSSNGKVLYEWCRSINPRTWHIGAASELRPEWFHGAATAGVCGATSTPRWLLEQVAAAIENLH